MLVRILFCLIAFLGYAWQNSLQGERVNGQKEKFEKWIDIATYVSSICYIILVLHEGYAFKGALKICFFIAVCVYCRKKKSGRMCTPFWKMLRMVFFVSFTMIAIKGLIWMYTVFKGEMFTQETKVMICISVVGIWICSFMLIAQFFEKKLKSRKAARFYY